jgi:glutathione S-transferase
MSSKPVLGYWRIRGLGQPIRLLLAYLQVDYDEKLYDERDDWLADKEKLGLDFPNLPYWKDGKKDVTESRAIMKYLCRIYKPELLGKTVEAQTDIDAVDNMVYDIFYSGIVPVIYQFTEELHKQYKQNEPLKLGYLNKFLKDKQWVAGNDLTYVDFFLYEVLRDLRVYDAKCLDAFAALQAYCDRVESLPAIKKYMESPNFIKSPIFGKEAIIKI